MAVLPSQRGAAGPAKWRRPLLAAGLLLFAALLLMLLRTDSIATPAQQQPQPKQQQEQSAAGRWADAPPEVSLATQLPAWANCAIGAACDYAKLQDGEANMELPFTGQWQEDEWLWNRIFYKKRGGFYLEMGAMDGVKLSNTHWLHQAAGWRGLLIEACPEQYSHLAKNRRGDICVNAAVCGAFQTVHWISKDELGGILEFFDPGLLPDGVNKDELPEIPCVPMQYILDRFGISHIDLWSLDVEGAELEVLRTVDWSRLTVGALVVETDGLNAEKDAQVVKLLEGQGFIAAERGPNRDRWTRNGQNTFFVHSSFKRSHAPDAERLYVET